jgi:transposase
MEAVQEVTGHNVQLAYVDAGSTYEQTSEAANKGVIGLEVVKLPQAKRGFVLLLRRWVVERPFAWTARFRWPVTTNDCLKRCQGCIWLPLLSS